ncbi:MAG: hypothetical protein ACE5HU_08810 [Acidobacteriota bacterium]
MGAVTRACFVVLLASVPVAGGQQPRADTDASASPAKHIVRVNEATPVLLRMEDTISTTMAHKKPEKALLKDGDTFDLSVVEDVKSVGETVIRAGAKAQGTIVKILPRRRMGKPGILQIRVDWVEAVDGTKIAVRENRDLKGQNRYGTAATVGYFTLGLGLLKHGKDVELKKGTEISCFTNSDTEILIPPGNDDKSGES